MVTILECMGDLLSIDWGDFIIWTKIGLSRKGKKRKLKSVVLKINLIICIFQLKLLWQFSENGNKEVSILRFSTSSARNRPINLS